MSACARGPHGPRDEGKVRGGLVVTGLVVTGLVVTGLVVTGLVVTGLVVTTATTPTFSSVLTALKCRCHHQYVMVVYVV